MSIFSGFGAKSKERKERRAHDRKCRRSEGRGYSYARDAYSSSPTAYGTFEKFWDRIGHDVDYFNNKECYRIGARRFYMELEDKQAT